MASLLQEYAEKNRVAGDNSYDIPEATPAIAVTPMKGAIIRGDANSGFTRWDALSKSWVPVKTVNYQGKPLWFDDRTRQFYPFQASQEPQMSTDEAKAKMDRMIMQQEKNKASQVQPTTSSPRVPVEEFYVPVKNAMGQVVSREVRYKDAKGNIYTTDPNE